MAHADDEHLAALALAGGEGAHRERAFGEPGDAADVPAEVRAHVATCSTCRRRVEELADLADLTRSLRGETLSEPSPEVWLSVAAEIAGDQQPGPGAPTVLTAVPLRPDRGPRAGRPRRRVPAWLAAAAAAVALVAGVGGGWAAGHRGEHRDTDVVASTTLAALTGHRDLGSAQVLWTPGHTTLRVSLAAPSADADGLHEVWLLNDDGKRMVALGLLQSDDRGAFDVPQRLLDEGYRTVDISLEPDDGNPAHSGVSLARGLLVNG